MVYSRKFETCFYVLCYDLVNLCLLGKELVVSLNRGCDILRVIRVTTAVWEACDAVYTLH